MKHSKKTKKAIQRARRLYETFTGFEWDGEYNEIKFYWPMPQGVFAYASAIGYYSDKWDYIWKSFIHKHEPPYPVVLRQHFEGEDLRWNRPFAAIDNHAYTDLGRCLDIQIFFEDPDEPAEHIDYKHLKKSNLPILSADPTRNLLIIREQHGRMPRVLLIWSPILRITARGIEY